MYIGQFILYVDISNARLWNVYSATINIRQAQYLFIKKLNQLHVATVIKPCWGCTRLCK